MQQILEEIIRRAGTYVLGAGERESTEKSNAKDFVTIADIKTQNILQKELQQAFPDVQVISEEHDESERSKLADPNFTGFVIDPIDGTYNFKRDLRESAISIGYIESGTPKVGVIYDPYKDELFAASVGKGATCNGQPIHVSKQAEIAGASIGTSNSYDDAAMARNLRRHLAIYERSHTMPWTHCHGSGVIIMCNIACGRFDIYHHNGLKPWDNAAAFLLIREAGGIVLQLNGQQAPFISSTILAGNPELVAKLQDIFTKIDPKLLT